MANIITTLSLEMSANWYVTKKLNSIGRVGENTVTKLIIEPTEILDNVTYEIEIADASGSKNVAELTIDGTELYLILTANMLTVSGIMKMQIRGLFEDGSIKKSNIFELKVNRSISATEHYEEYAVTIFDQLVQDCRDIIDGAESYAIRAETAAVNAEAYEQSASASAATASTASETAQTASTTAVSAKASAESASAAASASAETATSAANSASASATSATTSAVNAASASVTAQSASEAAQTASTTATTAATSAENSATSATAAANNASASATSAASSATNASNSATSAATSASNAAASETNAAASATAASTSEANANTSATNAANSATSAATSATNAYNSEVNASTSETNAGVSAAEAEASAESIAASVAQINENTYRINDLEAIIAGYQEADLPTGAVATVTDGTALLMPSLKIGIEPAQDLHGYDHPWAGGAGKNLFPCLSNQTGYGVTLTVDKDGTITLNGTCTQSYNFLVSGTLEAGNYSLCDFAEGQWPSTYQRTQVYGGNVIYLAIDNSDPSQKVANATSANGGNVTFRIRVEKDFTYNNNKLKPMLVKETVSTMTYEPYSNICPISGWTAANVYVSPTTDAEDGTTYTIQFRDGDNPLTVYGGTLDVVSGELVVDRANIDMGNLSWAYDASYNRFASDTIPNTEPPSGARITSFISSIYEVIDDSRPISQVTSGQMYSSFNNTRTNAIVMVHDNRFTDATLFRNAVAGQTFTYKLATPITYHLTPTQIRTLVGNNNIWADTGDIIEGKYFKSLS